MQRQDILITAEQLQAEMGVKPIKLFDASFVMNQVAGQPSAFDTYVKGHIPGAAFFDHLQISDGNSQYLFALLEDSALEKVLGNMGVDNASDIVVYATGDIPWATRAWWVLRYAGCNRVRILDGGLSAWVAVGGELEQGIKMHAPAVFVLAPRKDMFADKSEVLAAIEDGQVCTLNALPQASYAANHIKGSENLPCGSLWQGGGSFLPDAVLSEQLKPYADNKRVLSYCGGGIAATSNAVACLLAGYPNVAVYDGSMSEWTGEQLPISSL